MEKEKRSYLKEIYDVVDNPETSDLECQQVIAQCIQTMIPQCIPLADKYGSEDFPIAVAIMDTTAKHLIKSLTIMGKHILEMVLGSTKITATGERYDEAIYRPLLEDQDAAEYESNCKLCMADIVQSYMQTLQQFNPEDYPMAIGVIKVLLLAREENMSQEDIELKERIRTMAEKIAKEEWQ